MTELEQYKEVARELALAARIPLNNPIWGMSDSGTFYKREEDKLKAAIAKYNALTGEEIKYLGS